MTTKVITSFSSEDPGDSAEEQPGDKYDFQPVFEALVHNQEVAENVFARVAKSVFRSLLTDVVHVKMCLPDEVEPFPVWVVQSSITLRTSADWDTPMWASFLENLVVEQANQVLRIRDDNEALRLIGPLSTKIVEVGSGIFTFSIKQQWGLDG